ncbi:MAG: FAD-binding oxidoreductase, partial [Microvirgula sp.]
MIPAAALAELSSLLGDRLSTTRSVCDQHGRDESPYPAMPPDAVAFAESTDEVARIVQVCARHRVPVIPYGAGSSIEGHLLAIRGGLSLDLSRMTRIIAIDADDLTATVEAGVTREALNDALRHSGLFFPIDPGANA